MFDLQKSKNEIFMRTFISSSLNWVLQPSRWRAAENESVCIPDETKRNEEECNSEEEGGSRS